jgi:hypothetical protein
MPFREIPRRGWSRFLDSFSREHVGCECSLEVAEHGSAWRSSFQGATVEPGRDLHIFFGERPDEHAALAVSAPTSISVETTNDGSDRGLRVKSDGGSLLLRFRSPQPSEVRLGR